MNKTIKFVNENSVEDCVKYIEEKKLDKEIVIEKSKAARTEFGLKVQELIEILSDDKEYCPHCAEKGIKEEIFSSGIISRCLRCNKATEREVPPSNEIRYEKESE